jgi:chemotaxis protein methyltransferase CheR
MTLTMNKSIMQELGIVDTRNIINTITEKYNYDFSDYALISFKRRLEKILESYNLKYTDVLINKLVGNDRFFEIFLDALAVPSTEMFRDPSLWRIMRDEIIPAIHQDSASFKIWLPNSVSGDELFSLAILLHEMGLLNKAQILVSCMSSVSIETIRSGVFSNSKFEISSDNYIRANGEFELSKYVTLKDGIFTRDTSLIQNVTFIKQNSFLEPVPPSVKLILFRNKMIYFNQTLQGRIYKTLYNALTSNGFLVIGTKESLNSHYGNNDFIKISKTESIFKPRT